MKMMMELASSNAVMGSSLSTTIERDGEESEIGR